MLECGLGKEVHYSLNALHRVQGLIMLEKSQRINKKGFQNQNRSCFRISKGSFYCMMLHETPKAKLLQHNTLWQWFSTCGLCLRNPQKITDKSKCCEYPHL